VDPARQKLLAGAAFALDKNRGLGHGHALGHGHQLGHVLRGEDQGLALAGPAAA